jgi:signal peptidase II
MGMWGAWITGSVIVLDQLVKWLVQGRLALGESVALIPGFLHLTRVHNTGAAFGFLNDINFAFKGVVLALASTAALAGLAIYAAMLSPDEKLTKCGLSFVIGGAVGNLIDRVRTGYVLDFVDAFWGGWHFWAFNVADAAITVGVALMILDLLGVGRHRVSRAL